jgi:hypothetical protein
MLRRVAILRTDVSEEHIVSIIRVTGIGALGTLAITSNRSTLRRNTIYSSALYSPETLLIWSLVHISLKG